MIVCNIICIIIIWLISCFFVFFGFFCLLVNSASLSSLILPGAIYLAIMPRDSKRFFQAASLAVFGVVIMVAVVAVTIISFV